MCPGMPGGAEQAKNREGFTSNKCEIPHHLSLGGYGTPSTDFWIFESEKWYIKNAFEINYLTLRRCKPYGFNISKN